MSSAPTASSKPLINKEGAPRGVPSFFLTMKSWIPLLLPLATLVGYLLTGSFWLRSGTTLLCLFLIILRTREAVLHTAVGFVALALALSFCGDYVLGHWGGSFEGFVCGVGLFLLAHLGYVAYCLCRGRLRWGWLVALCLVFGAGYYGVLLRPHIGDAVTSVAVLAYVLVSCLSMAAALGLKKKSEFSEYSEYSEKPDGASLSHILFAVGIASLLFSDLLIAQKRFLGDDTLYALMMPTYFASQLLVTASILHNTRRK